MISGKKRAALGAVAAAVLALVGCSEGMTSPRVRPTTAKMAISAAISAQSATKALLVAMYASQSTEGIPIGYQGDTTLSTGLLGVQVVDLADSSNSVQMSIDLASCLNDPKVKLLQLSLEAPADQCPYVSVAAFLLSPTASVQVRTFADFDSLWMAYTGQYSDTTVHTPTVLDADYIPAFAVSTGTTAVPDFPLALHEVAYLNVSQYSLALTTGQSGSVTATRWILREILLVDAQSPGCRKIQRLPPWIPRERLQELRPEPL